jgi:hypothetical protein
MNKISIEELWRRLKELEGQEFKTIRSLPFTFDIVGKVFHPSRTKYNIGQSDFEKALALVPLSGPGKLGDLVRGQPYIWAVLHDERVRRNDW